MRRCWRCTASDRAGCCPIAPCCSKLPPEQGARARGGARRRRRPIGSARASGAFHADVAAAFRRFAAAEPDRVPADRCERRRRGGDRARCWPRSPTCCHDVARSATRWRSQRFRGRAGRRALHHAWLLAGPEGRRQGELRACSRRGGCWRGRRAACRRLRRPARTTARAADRRRSASRFHASSNGLPKDEKKPEQDLARSITVDQVRALQPLFCDVTPTYVDRRVVVIDAVDDLERSGANALLKNLEEPPAGTIFLLVSHAPGRLLPTIRSRCRLLRFEPLDDADDARARCAMPAPKPATRSTRWCGWGRGRRAARWRLPGSISPGSTGAGASCARGRPDQRACASQLAKRAGAQGGAAALRSVPRPRARASSPTQRADATGEALRDRARRAMTRRAISPRSALGLSLDRAGDGVRDGRAGRAAGARAR